MSKTVADDCARLELTIQTTQETFVLPCLCHRSENPSERNIEQEFYENGAPEGIPQGTHYEMELMQGPWDRPGMPKLHIHPNRATGRKFVCWTGRLPNIELALVVFEHWSMGTVYTMTTGKDFVLLVTQLKNDWGAIYSRLEKDFGIKLIDTKVVE